MKSFFIAFVFLCMAFLMVLGENLIAKEAVLQFYEVKKTTTTIEQKVRIQDGKMYVRTCVTSTTDCYGQGSLVCFEQEPETECGPEMEYSAS